MSSRGTRTIDGHVPDGEYDTVKELFGAKILIGKKNGTHNLPDYSHSPNRIYIREDKYGFIKEMRVYNEEKRLVLEIAYHPEPKISGKQGEPVLHMHTFRETLIN